VKTKDGYLLKVHRIPNSNPPGTNPVRPVVLLQHGVLCDSSMWVVGPADFSLGFILANAGFDVWMGNYRGNRYAMKHSSFMMNPDLNPKFWDYSFDEHGKYDIPAMVDYALTTSGQSQLDFVGHSMGGGAFYTFLSFHPQYAAKIRSMIGLASAAFISHARSPLRPLANLVGTYPASNAIKRTLIDVTPASNIFRYNQIVAGIVNGACSTGAPFVEICKGATRLLFGGSALYVNQEVFERNMKHFPAGTSLKTLLHYAQNILYSTFKRWDYGDPGSNMIAYGHLTAPEYDLRMATVPTWSFYSKGDLLLDYKDSEILHSKLPNLKQSILIDRDSFGHMDYIDGADLKEKVNIPVLNILKTVNGRA